LCAGFLLAGLGVQKAAAANDGSDWFVRPWQSDDGLPNSTVTGVAQTPDGYLWLATPSGLARFDGVHFQQFSLLGYVGDQNRGVLAMSFREGSGLTLALDRGAILMLNSGTAQAFTVGSGLPDLIPMSVAQDAEGTVWVAYRGGSICRIKGGTPTLLTPRDGAPGGSGNCAIAVDANRRLWFLKLGQFGCVRDGQFTNLNRFDPLPGRLAAARDGGLWVCSGPRLFKYRGGQPEPLGACETEDMGTEPTALLEDHTGAVWLGTSFRGLFRYEANEFERIPTSHSQILSLTEDHQGNIWAATGGGGLDRIRPRAVALEGVESGLPFETVQSVCEDSTGNLWATTQNGSLVRRLADKWAPIPTNEIYSGSATCLAADPSGAVWVGTLHHGLFCWRDGGFVPCKKVKAHSVHALLVSQKGDLWIVEANPNLLQRLRGGRLETVELPGDLRGMRAIAEDAAGNIWVGTSRGVLLRVTEARAVDMTRQVTDFPKSIRCLYATPDGSLWIGFAGWGIGRLKEGRLVEIMSEQGLYDDYISRIIADGQGWFWLGSDRGIFKVRQRELDEVAESRASSVQSIPYGRSEGLPSLQASFGDSPSGLRSRDGRLWIPMRTGLVSVNPDEFHEDSQPLPVLLSRVAVDDQTVAWYGGMLPTGKEHGLTLFDLQERKGGLRLPPRHRRVEFDYTAMDFVRPETVRFRYRLHGLDDSWVEAGAQRSATYLRLPSGSYQFEVRACNQDGVWSETGPALSLVVEPFIWETWWFRTIAVTVLTLSGIAVVRYVSFRRLQLQLQKAQREAALHQERARIAKDIHDDLGANLTQIALLSEFARQDRTTPAKVDAHTEKISATARQAVKSLDEIVWAVNPHNDTLAELIDYTQQFALDYLQLAGIRCRLDFPEQLLERNVSADVRHNLFLVVKETLNNVVKHAEATEVSLQLAAVDGALRIVIDDNGHGFDGSSEHRWANGLKNMRQRMQEVGGQCRVESQPGQGTRVTLELPWSAQGLG
jgi:signal transduction histidine kinase/ligand-binding sensor domain-containing protein